MYESPNFPIEILIANVFYAKQAKFVSYKELSKYRTILYKTVLKKYFSAHFFSQKEDEMQYKINGKYFCKTNDGILSINGNLTKEWINEVIYYYDDDIKELIKQSWKIYNESKSGGIMEDKEKKLKTRIETVEKELEELRRIKKELLNKKTVKEYIEHLEKIEKLKKIEENVIYDYEVYKISNCDHDAIAFFNFEHDDYEGRSYYDCGCLKCGLNTFIIKNQSTFKTPESRAMLHCYKENGFKKGKHVIDLNTYYDFLNECNNYKKEQEKSKIKDLKIN